MSPTSNFRLWLESQNYSPSTVRNYLVDINKMLSRLLPSNTQDLTPARLRNYLSSISSDQNYHRQLSSLNKFFQFALDQHLISQNPLKSALKPAPLQLKDIIKSYQSYLLKKNKTPSTIKNYINDIQQYLSWFETNQNKQ